MTAFIDARSDDIPETLEGSVCIIGAGAAGITLARKLAETMPGVLLIESGGFDIDGQTQGLFNGQQLGIRYYNLVSCRLRYFGGTTNHWSGFCRANDPVDYEGRPEVGLPKWPINGGDLAPYIAEAGESLAVSAEHFEPKELISERGGNAENLAEDYSEMLLTKAFQFSTRRRLGPLYKDEIAASPNVQGVLNLNLTHIQLNPEGNRVDHLVCKTLDGKVVRVTAKAYTLCCHAIENARQLLNSNDVMPTGVGNAHDHVGRYFMDHTHIFASKFIPTKAFPKVYDRKYSDDKGMNVNLSFTDSFTRDNKLLQYYCRFNPVYASEEAIAALDAVRLDRGKPGSLDYLRDVATVAGEVMGLGRYYMTQKEFAYPQPEYYEMEHRLEQMPNPDSRVVISDRKDALDTYIADLDWRLMDDDIRSFREGQAIMSRELAALGWGRVEEEEITRELVESRVAGHYHQIGTTRMSVAPEDGVVDADCKVHGIDNLYIGGSSVFPTAGYSGPTMMLIALAMRMSDHLKERFA